MWRDYKAVLWDFDGVIVDTEWPIYQAWQSFFEKNGQDLSLEMYVKCIGSDFATWSPEKYLEELTGRTFDWEAEGVTRNVEIRRRLEDATVNPGIVDVWTAMRDAGLRLAVVSSSSHDWVDGWLEKLNLTDFIETTVCRGDVPRIKPAPDLYLEGARQVGFSPGECLVIEDSLNGLISAQAAGCDCCVVPNQITQILDFPGAKVRIDDIRELLID